MYRIKDPKRLKTFFLTDENVREAIDSNNFQKLFDGLAKSSSLEIIRIDFLHSLYNIGIHPLEYMDSISPEMFSQSDIKEVFIPHGIKVINHDAFFNCAIEKLYICKDIETIIDGDWLFAGCSTNRIELIFEEENSLCHEFQRLAHNQDWLKVTISDSKWNKK